MEDNGKRKRADKKLIRMQVIKAAAEAFSQKGIKNVRMDDIASSLSISKRTLYELFADKEELLDGIIYRCDMVLFWELWALADTRLSSLLRLPYKYIFEFYVIIR